MANKKTIKKLVDSYESKSSSTKGKISKLNIPQVDSFTDSNGTEWTPKITTPVLVETCREVGLTIADLLNFNINVADLFEALWISCRSKATELDISKELFMERVTPDVLIMGFAAYWNRVAATFPSLQLVEKLQGGPASTKGPLGSGK